VKLPKWIRKQDVDALTDRELDERRVSYLASLIRMTMATFVVALLCAVFAELGWQQAQSNHSFVGTNKTVLCANLRGHIESTQLPDVSWYVKRYKASCAEPNDPPLRTR
jgi:hypothetical protein